MDEKENQKKSETHKKNDLLKSIRVIQGLFLGVFVLGISMSIGDLLPKTEFPVSSLSVTTTCFGLFGYMLCEWFARKAEKW